MLCRRTRTTRLRQATAAPMANIMDLVSMLGGGGGGGGGLWKRPKIPMLFFSLKVVAGQKPMMPLRFDAVGAYVTTVVLWAACEGVQGSRARGSVRA